MEFSHITIKGARVHNLRNISLQIPRNRFVVITGLSGSGKSSLAFDTIYAEGQRRFMETLSPYARQYIGNIERPDVDFIEGLSPVIAIDQKSTSRSPRSTVGTITEIHNFTRLLFAKAGRRYDPVTGQMLQKQSEESIVDSIMALEEGTKIQILSPLVTGRKGHYRELFERLMLKGWLRVRVDGQYRELEKNMQLERYKTHTIDLVVDRIALAPDLRERISKAVTLAIANSEHRSTLSCDPLDKETKEMVFSTRYAYSDGSVPVDTLAPNHFSFNSPFGACPECNGLGELMQLSAQLMIPDTSRSLNEGGLEPLGKPGKETHGRSFVPSPANTTSASTPPLPASPTKQCRFYFTDREAEPLMSPTATPGSTHPTRKNFPEPSPMLKKSAATPPPRKSASGPKATWSAWHAPNVEEQGFAVKACS